MVIIILLLPDIKQKNVSEVLLFFYPSDESSLFHFSSFKCLNLAISRRSMMLLLLLPMLLLLCRGGDAKCVCTSWPRRDDDSDDDDDA